MQQKPCHKTWGFTRNSVAEGWFEKNISYLKNKGKKRFIEENWNDTPQINTSPEKGPSQEAKS